MKKILLLLAGVFAFGLIQAQSFLKAEYYIDTDPGPGNGTAVTVPAGGDQLNFTMNVSTAALSPGFHLLNVRMQQADGSWGLYETRGFYLSSGTAAAADISAAEYFFDTDPGPGNGTPLSVTSGATVNLNAAIPLGSLGSGFHILTIRMRGTDGVWGLYESRGIYISDVTSNAANISAAEYFFDTDPGPGNGTAIPVTSGATVTLTAAIPSTGLSNGFHLLAIRTKGSDGIWGLFETRGIYISAGTANAADITAAEFFMDTDPGPGNGTTIPVPTGSAVSLTAVIPSTGLAQGFHILAIRTKGSDGVWGLFESRGLYVSGGTANAANITAAEYFIDTDPGKGNGTAITVPSGAAINLTVPLNPAALTPGFHILAIRTMGADGIWGLFESRGFYVTESPAVTGNIVAAEFFFDADPGPGNGTPLAITTPGATVTQTFDIPLPPGISIGQHFLAIRVKDSDGKWSLFDRGDTVRLSPNQVPIANAGPDITITLPVNSATLNGSASTDPDGTIASYAWTKISGPAGGTIANPNQASSSITSLVVGVYQYELVVTDNIGATSKDTVKVTVNPALNIPPVANAGPDQTITLPTNTVNLTGAASSDADGTITTYAWTKISGPATGTIASPAQVTTAVNSLVQGVYEFQLTVTDNSGATAKDTVKVTVNAAPNVPPVANAGPDQTITLPTNTVNLTGAASSDADGTITTYAWTKISGPAAGTIASPAQVTTAVNSLVQGVYEFQLTVTDNSGATAKDTVKVTVNAAPNVPPVANAGPDQTITLPTNTVNLTGAASSDADGTITTYAWTKISGPAAGTIASPAQVTTAVNSLVQGVYEFQLTVTDNSGATAKDTVKVTVNAAPNVPPVANAGPDQTITLPTNTVNLTGAASSDADGTITTYAWTKISGPAAGTIASPAQVTTAVNSLVQGVYEFQLTVTDNNGATAKDTVKVTVNPAPNIPPVANAGADQSITLPVNTVNLSGAASTDADGTITTYAWTKISGPAAGTIASPAQVTTAVNSLVQGVYEFQLTVTDNSGATARDTVKVTVNAAPNVPPVANAGPDQVITLPSNTVTLNGNASNDPDGTISSFSWTKISGPAGGILSNPNQSTTIVSNLAEGTYEYELRVVDNLGLVSTDRVRIQVNANPNPSLVYTCFFPNPASGLTRVLVQNEQIVRIVVYNSIGQRVLVAENPQNGVIDVSKLAAGTYFARISLKALNYNCSFMIRR